MAGATQTTLLFSESSISSTMENSTVTMPTKELGTLQYVEVVYLILLTVTGTLGNLIVISSISLERRVHAHGNVFIINLAIADLIVTGFLVPTVIANVIENGNALSDILCKVVGYLVTVTCTCSLCNLMFIALNRYWAVVRSGTYTKVFSRKRVYLMVLFTWGWSTLLVMPTTLGWGGLRYDEKIMICSWDDQISTSFTVFITICAVFIPLCIIGACYYKLFATVRGSGRWVRSLSVGSGISQNNEQNRRSLRKEQNLLKTLLTTVVLFCICWLPFGFVVVINPGGIDSQAKKFCGWIALSNSCVNFIVYGAMNPVFRRGYHNLFVCLFRCKRAQKISSTMLHGSFSDSFRAIRRVTKSNENAKPVHRSGSDPGHINSRIDTIAGAQTQITLANNSPALSHTNQLLIHSTPKTPTSDKLAKAMETNKKGIVQSIRRSSLLRKPRPRLPSQIAENTSEQERQARMKRNSAMLLQVQVGDDNWSLGDSEDLSRGIDDRLSRRAMSDVPSRNQPSAIITANRQMNGNSNSVDKMNISVISKADWKADNTEEIARSQWMPQVAVYKSSNSTPVRRLSSPVKRKWQPNGVKVSPKKAIAQHNYQSNNKTSDVVADINIASLRDADAETVFMLESNSSDIMMNSSSERATEDVTTANLSRSISLHESSNEQNRFLEDADIKSE